MKRVAVSLLAPLALWASSLPTVGQTDTDQAETAALSSEPNGFTPWRGSRSKTASS